MAQKIFKFLILLLSIVVLATLVYSVLGSYFLLTNLDSNLPLSSRLSLLPAMAISSGVLVAIFTFYQDREKHISKVYLDRAIEGFNTTINLLSDRNNDRVIWIRAARTLLKTIELKYEIRSAEYLKIFDLEEERARNQLYDILSIKAKKGGQRQSLPPEFFYGIDDWESCKNLDQAAIQAKGPIVAHTVTIHEVPPQPEIRQLSEPSIIAIYNFIQFPKDYSDPLKKVPEWGNNWEASMGIDQGARRYVAHQKENFVVNGEIKRRNNPTKGN